MQREREQFWLIAACVIAAHAGALAVTTLVWAYGSDRDGEPSKSIEVAATDPVVLLKEIQPDPNTLGEANGTGDSIATVDAPQPSVTDKPDDLEQAWTRQKPAPLPRPAAEATEAAESPSQKKEATKAASEFGPLSVTAISPLAVKVPESRNEGKATEPPTEPQAEHVAVEHKATEPNEAEPAPTEEAQSAKPTEAQQASADEPDPAQQGESDLDPFAKEEGVSFTPGGTMARQGREVKLARPRIDLGFMADATRMSGRDLVVRMSIETDGVGHPTRVSILDTSGSNTIDDAVRLAMYDSWFGGKMPDRFPFTVRFVRR
jgi:hypothetical protein